LFKQLSTLLSVQRSDDVSKKKNSIKSVVSRKQCKRIPSSVKNVAVSRRKTHELLPVDHPSPGPPSDNTDDDVINTTVNNDCDKRSTIVTRSKGRVGNMVKAVKMPWKKCSVVIPMGSHGVKR
uniref:Uncharacterized protein n=1 Tax=Ciona savignyi TaxID=51511 RepID=H2Z8J0_CIOSA